MGVTDSPDAIITQDRPAVPLEAFPSPARDMAAAVADATGGPVDFAAVSILVAAGAAIGASRTCTVNRTWEETPHLYAVMVGRPGVAKSPVLRMTLKPLYDENDRLFEDWSNRSAEYNIALLEHEQSVKRWKAEHSKNPEGAGNPPAEPEKPILRSLIIDDATTEAVVSVLRDNPRGALLASDELLSWFRSLDAYRGGKGSDRQFYLNAWDGGQHSVRRVTREPIHLPRTCLSVLGAMQPDLARAFSRENEDGLFDRFLVTFPEEPPLTADGDDEEGVPESVEREYNALINQLLNLNLIQGQPVSVPLTPEAAARFKDIKFRCRSLSQVDDRLAGFYAKGPRYIARLALIIQALRWAAQEGDLRVIDERSVLAAQSLFDYFVAHKEKLLDNSELPKEVAALISWIKRRGMYEATERETYTHHVGGARTKAAARELFKKAQELGVGMIYVEQEDGPWVFRPL